MGGFAPPPGYGSGTVVNGLKKVLQKKVCIRFQFFEKRQQILRAS